MLTSLKFNRPPDLAERKANGDISDYYQTTNAIRYRAQDGTPLLVLVDFSDAYYNAKDYNRVETATMLVRDRLREHGYTVAAQVKTNWTVFDFSTSNAVTRVRRNIDALQAGFYRLPDWRAILYNNTLDIEQANTLEWDLHIFNVWINRMCDAFIYSGELFAAEQF